MQSSSEREPGRSRMFHGWRVKDMFADELGQSLEQTDEITEYGCHTPVSRIAVLSHFLSTAERFVPAA